MQFRVLSQPDIVLDHISVATGIVPVLYKASIARISAKSMKRVTPHVSAVSNRHVVFLERC